MSKQPEVISYRSSEEDSESPPNILPQEEAEVELIHYQREETSPEILQKKQEMVHEIESGEKKDKNENIDGNEKIGAAENESNARVGGLVRFESLPQMTIQEFRTYYKTSPLTSITSLNISNNRAANLSLPNLVCLKELNVSHNSFKKVPSIIECFTQLTRLDISYNYIKTLGILKRHPSIRYLDVRHNNIQKLVFDRYETANNLIHFDITDNYIASPLDSSQNFYYTFPSIYFQRSPTFIIWGLYLGSVNATEDVDFLKNLGIGAILSVGKRPINQMDSCNLFISIEDTPSDNIGEILQTALLFIDENIKRRRAVLIHCECGVSRSASVVIAYLMKKYDMTYKTALEFVCSKRKCVFPNRGFERQLLEFEKEPFTFGVEKEKPKKKGWFS